MDEALVPEMFMTHGRETGGGRGRRGRGGRGAHGGRGRGRGRGGGRGERGAGGAPVAMAEGREDGDAHATEEVAAPRESLELEEKPSRSGKKDRKGKKGGERPATIDTTTTKGKKAVEMTPVEQLVNAIRTDDTAQFTALLKDQPKLSVNARTREGDAVLVEACRFARVDMVKTLIQEKKADVNMHSTNDKAGRKYLRPLHAAVMALNESTVDELLAAPGQDADLSLIYDVAMPATIAIFYCVANGYTEKQEAKALRLLEKLIQHAQHQGEEKLKKMLETETNKGNRLAHIAVIVSNYRAVELLQKAGADFTAPNSRGLTPLQLVESNTFGQRTFAVSHLPMLATPTSLKRQGRQGRQHDVKLSEHVSAAEKEFGGSRPTKPLDRDLENKCVLKTLLPLVDVFGLGAVFSRKGHDSIRSIHVKSLVLAHHGIISVMNKIASLPDDLKAKPVYVDGVMHCVTNLHSLALKNDRSFGKLWKQAFENRMDDATKTSEALTGSAVEEILGVLLQHKTLSRRIRVWTMVLLRSLDVFAGESALTEDCVTPKVPTNLFKSVEPYERIADAIHRSGSKMLFSIYDRTEMDEDESYDEELEFHLIIALTELFFQLFIPLSPVVKSENDTVGEKLSRAARRVLDLWHLLSAALANVDETFGSPQRFSLILHVLQVFEVVKYAVETSEGSALQKLFKILKQFAHQEASRKHMVYETAKQVRLFQRICDSFPLPTSMIDRIVPLKDKIDVLLRSDAKILGLDLYAFARHSDFVRLEHKIDYLEVLSEEESHSIHVTVSRTSNADYVEFIMQQILSTSSNQMKGELDITLVDEPGVGAGVVREFFQIIQHTFFKPVLLDAETASALPFAPPPSHVSEIGSQWLQLARDNSPSLNAMKTKNSNKVVSKGELLRFFPMFEFATDKSDVLRIRTRKLQVAKEVVERKKEDGSMRLAQSDVIVNDEDAKTLSQLYLCAGRLLGLAIRDQQPLDANFPVVFWRFMLGEQISWEEYCGSNEVFKRSLQFVIGHDFDASPLDMQFNYTAEVIVLNNEGEVVETTAMEIELPGAKGATVVTNANKQRYVELRAKQFFFGNELPLYQKMRDGLLDTIRKVDLKLFLPAELKRIVHGDRTIDLAGLRKSVIYTRGVSEAHEVVRYFWEVVETFDETMKGKLLTFWSGSALPPLFGFDATSRTNPHAANWFLDLEPWKKTDLCPTANTCDRRLILPLYPTKEALRSKLLVALEHGAVGYDRM